MDELLQLLASCAQDDTSDAEDYSEVSDDAEEFDPEQEVAKAQTHDPATASFSRDQMAPR